MLLSCAAFKVSIQVDYSPPSDFSLPSPPYYRPASSVSLTCVASHDAVLPLTYHWTSTETRSFAHERRESVISQRVLTVHDAGVHQCTVTDGLGNTAVAATEIKLFGKHNIYMTPQDNIHMENVYQLTLKGNTSFVFSQYLNRNGCFCERE